MAENDGKIFNFYLNLPAENRKKIIDKMQTDDRCRFIRCSKLCGTEVKISKNFIFELEFDIFAIDEMTIKVVYGPRNSRHGFILKFRSYSGNVRICCNLINQKLWEDKLENSADLFRCALKEFKNRLQQSQNIVRKLSIIEHYLVKSKELLKNVNFGVENLENLEELALQANINFLQFTSKLHHPLKTLFYGGNDINIGNCPQLYQAQKNVIVWYVQLDKAQFNRLTARNVWIPMGNLTEMNILQFIRSWQNGSIGREIGDYRWDVENSNFSMTKLFRLLRVRPTDEDESIEIKHFNKLGTSAILIDMQEDGLQFSAYGT